MRRLPATTSSTRSSTVPGTDQTVRDDRAGLTDAPGAVARLVFDRGVPPTVVEHDVTRGGEVEPGTAGLQREHEHARTVAALEVGDDLIARRARQTAVVARDRGAGALGEVVGELDAPLREVREHEHALAGREHRVDDLFEARELAGATLRAEGRRPGTRRGGCRSA